MKTAVFGYRTRNLGDDMQSAAIAMHLGRVDRLIDRDAMADEKLEEPHLTVFNSWFMNAADSRLPPKKLDPILYGFAIGREDRFLDRNWMAYLRDRGPVGCRDLDSMAILAERGVDAYWSGCLTLFLGPFFEPIAAADRQGVLFVDVAPEIEQAFIPEDIRRRAERISMFAPRRQKEDRLTRFAAIARLLDRLRRAELVVTRRLHVALPAVGFGTPTVTMPDPEISNARRRFSGFMEFLPGAFLGDQEKLRSIDWGNIRPATIPAALHAARDRLIASVRQRGASPHPGGLKAAFETPVTEVRDHGLGFEPDSVTVHLGSDDTSVEVIEWTDKSVKFGWPRLLGNVFSFEATLAPRSNPPVRVRLS